MPCSAPQNLSQIFALPFSNNWDLNKSMRNLYWTKIFKKFMLLFLENELFDGKNMPRSSKTIHLTSFSIFGNERDILASIDHFHNDFSFFEILPGTSLASI